MSAALAGEFFTTEQHRLLSTLINLLINFTLSFNSVKIILIMDYIIFYIAAAAKSFQSCPTLCDPRDGSPPGSPIPGIL